MARNTLRIKVRTDVLLANARAHRAKLVADHEKAQAKYEVDEDGYLQRVITALDAALVKAEQGKRLDHVVSYGSTSYLKVPIKGSYPSKPRLSTQQVDKDIALLVAAADDTLSISADDNFGRYL